MTGRVWRRAGLGLAAMTPFIVLLGYAALRGPPALRAPETEGTVAVPAEATAAPGHSGDVDRMIADLRGRLARQPGNVEDWVLLGRTLAAVERWQEAKAAFAQAIARNPAEPALHVQLGEVLTLQEHGRVTEAASAEFAHAPDDPRSRYYAAVALAQAGDIGQARQRLQSLAADAPADAPWRRMVEDELAALGPAPPAAAGGAAPIAALRDRVRTNPRDAEAWLALAGAYRAEGDLGHARDTLAQANAAVAGNLDLLLAYAQALAGGIDGETLPADFVAVMRQVEALDPDQPDALWYLGLADAARGDRHAAATRWKRLLAHLSPDSDEYKTVQFRLKSMP